MTRILAPLTLFLALALPGAAAADCYVHYKAKRDTPYGLHYGIVRVGGACPSAPAAIVRSRIASGGWSLLNVVKVTPSAPSSTEVANAGTHYYR